MALAISGVLLLGASQAEAAIISLQWNAPQVVGTTINDYYSPEQNNVWTYTLSGDNDSSYKDVQSLSSTIEIAPTTASTGLLYNYKDVTRNWTQSVETYQRDDFSAHVDTDISAQAGNKYIHLSGSVTATEDTSLYFYLSANGSFTQSQTPFGAITPALPGFYLGNDLHSLSSLTQSTNSYYDYGIYRYSTFSSGDNNLHLTAGTTTSFSAIVYAQNNVSLEQFHFYAETLEYAPNTITTSYSKLLSHTLIGAEILPALPVPEPEEWAMMMLGLPLMGFVARRKKIAA